MSKNILVLSSTPRRGGNSDLLCDQFISGAIEAVNRTEFFFLKDRKINYCTGAWNMGEIIGKPAMEQAFEAGRNV